jgi:hypothetical protein
MVVDFSANYQANFSLCRACPVKNQLYATVDAGEHGAN